jgi:hypothetical protein
VAAERAELGVSGTAARPAETRACVGLRLGLAFAFRPEAENMPPVVPAMPLWLAGLLAPNNRDYQSERS